MEKESSEKPAQISSCRLLPLGDAAVIVQFENIISPAVHRQLLQLAACIDESPIPGLIEWVVAYSSITLYYNPWQLSGKGTSDPFEVMREYVAGLLQKTASSKSLPSRLLEIPVCYGGVFGPDLEFVARYNGLSSGEVVQMHTEAEYLVYMLGFAPGFPYLGGLHARLATPRRESPRSKIPRGAVGIAGNQTGIYPLETPGGWQLIGRTPQILFDPNKSPATLLQAGDRLRFASISVAEFHDLNKGPHES